MGKEPRRAFMCAPTFFCVDPEHPINSWMERSVAKAQGDPVDRDLAERQWTNLCSALRENGVVISFIPPVFGLPDMVFTANAGFVYNGKIVISHFRHLERHGEEDVFSRFFETHTDLAVRRLPAEMKVKGKMESLYCEGHGDLLLYQNILFAGYGKRSNQYGIMETLRLAEFEGQCVFLELIDDNFYHLDTCFCPIGDYLLYYPKAFSEWSRGSIKHVVPSDKLIDASEFDAMNLMCNGVPLHKDRSWSLEGSAPSSELEKRLLNRQIHPDPLDLSEFRKSGGGARCLVLFR